MLDIKMRAWTVFTLSDKGQPRNSSPHETVETCRESSRTLVRRVLSLLLLLKNLSVSLHLIPFPKRVVKLQSL